MKALLACLILTLSACPALAQKKAKVPAGRPNRQVQPRDAAPRQFDQPLPVIKQPARKPGPIKLPFGETIRPGLMQLDRDKLEEIFRHEQSMAAEKKELSPLFISRVDGIPNGAHKHYRGKLHGQSVRVDDENNVRSLIDYQDGKRDGLLRYWDETEPRLYARYNNGVKEGVLCYYVGGKPYLAQRWVAGKLTNSCLIIEKDDDFEAIEKQKLSERQQKLFDFSVNYILQIEEELLNAEKDIKKECLASFKIDDESRRKWLASQKSVSARDSARERRLDAEAANGRAMNDLISRGARSAGW